MPLLQTIVTHLSELQEIKRTHRANVNSRIAELEKLRRYISAENEAPQVRATLRNRRMRSYIITRFNRHCPICGIVKPERMWVVVTERCHCYVQCLRCHLRGLRFRVEYADII